MNTGFKYNYKDEVSNSVYEWMKENADEIITLNWNAEELADWLLATLQYENSVTGVNSGSYTNDVYEAQDYLKGNLNLLEESMENSDLCLWDELSKGAEMCDSAIRYYVLADAIDDVINMIEKYAENMG